MKRSIVIYISICTLVAAMLLVGCGEDPAKALAYETLSFPATENIVDLHFVSGNEGYVATPGEVYFTDDAGSSFTRVYDSDGRDIVGVYFVNDDLGFIFGDAGLLARSEDAGQSWQLVSVDNNYHFTALAEVGEERLQIVGTLVSDSLPSPAFMGSSNDDGVNWSFGGVPYHDFSQIVSASETHSWILGSDAIMYTTDGGKTWEHAAARADLAINDLTFSDVAHGWEVSETGKVRYTENGGWSWEDKVTLAERALSAVDSPEADIVYVAGDRLIAMSSNHGLNWLLDDVTPPARMNAIQVTGGKVYVGGDNGTLLRLLY